MNQPIMRKIVVTGEYAPLAAGKLVACCDISCPPSNAGSVLFKCKDGSDVPWCSGEWHYFDSIDLSEVEVKGTPGDVVTVIGGTW